VLDVERFKSGFSSYDINGHAGLSVAAGTVLDVTVPVYTLAAFGQEGVVGAGGRELWTPPLYLASFASNKIVQRAGADLVLRSQRQFEGGDIAIGADAQITVDAGRSISLIGGGTSQITVDGALHAKSGKIAIDIVAALTSAADVAVGDGQSSLDLDRRTGGARRRRHRGDGDRRSWPWFRESARRRHYRHRRQCRLGNDREHRPPRRISR
jgi:hypothetical protein